MSLIADALTGREPMSVVRRPAGAAFRLRWKSELRAIVLVVAGVFLLAGCGFPDRSREADAITASIRELPGVQSAESRYDTSFDGGAHFNLDVQVGKDITPDQAAGIGESFAQQVAESKFDRFDVRLDIDYGTPASAASYEYNTSARFSYSFNSPAPQAISPSKDQVGDSLRLLTRVSQHPGVEAVTLMQPSGLSTITEQDPARLITVVLAGTVDQPQLDSLTAGFPELAKAMWIVQGQSTPSYRPNTYQIAGYTPTIGLRDLWLRIDKAAVAVGGRVSAQTVGEPSVAPGARSTTVDLMLGGGPDTDVRLRGAIDTVVPALTKLPSPTLLRMTWANEQASVMIGGCSAPSAIPGPLAPVQAELRSVYEHC